MLRISMYNIVYDNICIYRAQNKDEKIQNRFQENERNFL